MYKLNQLFLLNNKNFKTTIAVLGDVFFLLTVISASVIFRFEKFSIFVILAEKGMECLEYRFRTLDTLK